MMLVILKEWVVCLNPKCIEENIEDKSNNPWINVKIENIIISFEKIFRRFPLITFTTAVDL
jgi:hypothetical protein